MSKSSVHGARQLMAKCQLSAVQSLQHGLVATNAVNAVKLEDANTALPAHTIINCILFSKMNSSMVCARDVLKAWNTLFSKIAMYNMPCGMQQNA